MLRVNNEQLERFRTIKKQFLTKTEVPKPDNWKSRTNNDIWLDLINQVIVVGSSGPSEKFTKDSELRENVSYEKLLQIDNKEKLEKVINRALRTIGTRYASSDIRRCRKTRALVQNFETLKYFNEGPRGLVKLLAQMSEFETKNSEKLKIKFLMGLFAFLKSKGARDYLLELGLIENAIALDSRVQSVFKSVGISFPEGYETDPTLYDEIEQDILLKICKPLNLSGIEFDRMLYQNKDEILKTKFY